jgi:hypothetical protein
MPEYHRPSVESVTYFVVVVTHHVAYHNHELDQVGAIETEFFRKKSVSGYPVKVKLRGIFPLSHPFGAIIRARLPMRRLHLNIDIGSWKSSSSLQARSILDYVIARQRSLLPKQSHTQEMQITS